MNMATQPNSNTNQTETTIKITETSVPDSFTALSPLDLNNIKLDDKHTILTPEYLEKISQNSGN